jgi:hypothetical protein
MELLDVGDPTLHPAVRYADMHKLAGPLHLEVSLKSLSSAISLTVSIGFNGQERRDQAAKDSRAKLITLVRGKSKSNREFRLVGRLGGNYKAMKWLDALATSLVCELRCQYRYTLNEN